MQPTNIQFITVVSFFLLCILLGFFILHAPKKKDIPQASGNPTPTAYSCPFVLTELGEHPGIRSIQKNIMPIINNCITQELKQFEVKCNEPLESSAFQEKERLVMSFFYTGLKNAAYEPALISMLDLMQSLGLGQGPITHVALSTHADFFGIKKEDLVLKIINPTEDLNKLHHDLQQACTTLNNYYRQTHNDQQLFPTEEWDNFTFTPHVTLGRIKIDNITQAITEQRPDLAHTTIADIIEKIKFRILKEIAPLLEIDQKTAILEITQFELYGGDRTSIKTFYLRDKKIESNITK